MNDDSNGDSAVSAKVGDSPVFSRGGDAENIIFCCDVCRREYVMPELKWPMPGHIRVPTTWSIVGLPKPKAPMLVCDRHEITIGEAKDVGGS